MKTEIEKVFDAYDRRKNNDRVQKNQQNFYFNHFAQSERELKYNEIIKSRFKTLETVKFLEIGAGVGNNIYFFKKIGLAWDNIFANELLPDRFIELKRNFPDINTIEGDACKIPFENNSFDIILQSTVFTSILDIETKINLANKMWSLLKPSGIILWYDFQFDNPNNRDVKGICKKEVIELFKGARKVDFHKVTLAPPIGRRVKKLYPFLNIFPFLRTHYIGVIEKNRHFNA